jgi:serine/threonine-protein kinase
MYKSDYRKIGLVGEGQFGKVYGAINRQTGELVALKELNRHKISTKQFLREIRILLRTQHPNVLSFYGIEHEQQKRYLITEYCNAGTLRDLLNREQFSLSLKCKLRIIADVLQGLKYIHQEDIIHRDLKPENILLCLTNKGWFPKISDFGVAKIQSEDKDYNASAMGDTGSPAYMAPEQFYGKYSPQSDIYAIGIILFELLTGDRPFLGTPAEIMTGHLNQSPQFPDNIPDILKTIIQKALEKLPINRFRTAEEMRSEIIQATIKLSQGNESLFAQIPYQAIDYQLIANEELKSKINNLAIHNFYLYQTSPQQLIVEKINFDPETQNITYQSKNTYELPSEIIDLQLVAHGCTVIVCDNSGSNHYSLWHIDEKPHKLIEWDSDFFAYAVSNNLSWLAINKSQNNEHGFELFNLQKSTSITPLIEDFIPQQIINLNRNNGVVIYTQNNLDNEETYFRFFNRRGDWYNTYSIDSCIDKVIYHPSSKSIFLTKEKQTNYLLLINFIPFTIRRLALNFTADFYLASQQGFICASEEGRIAFLDLSGDYLGEINIQENIIAIAVFEDDKFIVIVEKEGQRIRQVYQVNLPPQQDVDFEQNFLTNEEN